MALFWAISKNCICLFSGRGVARVDRSKILTPQRRPARGGDRLRTPRRSTCQNRLRAGRNQKIPRSGEYARKWNEKNCVLPAAHSQRFYLHSCARGQCGQTSLAFECLQFVRASGESLFNWPRLLCARKKTWQRRLFFHYWVIACAVMRALLPGKATLFAPAPTYWFRHTAQLIRHNWYLDRLKYFDFFSI